MGSLSAYAKNLSKLAAQNELGPVIGRARLMERVMQILCMRGKNNPCLIGDPGVGKTAVAEGLAQLIANSKVPSKLLNKQVFSLDINRLVEQNSKEFTSKLREVVDEVKSSKGGIILFIDEVHTLVGGGPSYLDVTDILQPALATGELNCIAATTIDGYRDYIKEDPDLKRQFEAVDVPEPSVEEAVEIMKSLSNKYEAHHRVAYSYEALTAAARLSNRYIRDYFLPEKALSVIDEAGARVQLSRSQSSREIPIITDTDIGRIISSRTGIPLDKLTPSAPTKLLRLKETLKESFIGQDDAVEAIFRALCRDAAGVRDPSRPIASFLFTGPTGVGKTELAKAIAQEYFGSREAMVTIDMSEYTEEDSVSKLCGAPPGYRGYDAGGQLTEAIHGRPCSLVLFDQIEKAHDDVMNVMLQILDEGRLTDGKLRTVDFKNTLIIFSSKVGGSLITQTKIERSFEEAKNLVAEKVKEKFRAGFLNRLDEVIVFDKFSKAQLMEIADIRLEEVCKRIEMEKNIHVEVTEELKDELVEEGFDPKYGARPLKRAIESHIVDKVARLILQGIIGEGDRVQLGINSSAIKILD